MIHLNELIWATMSSIVIVSCCNNKGKESETSYQGPARQEEPSLLSTKIDDIFADKDSVFLYDVDFDDKRELLITTEGYNVKYYKCYKINYTDTPHIIPMEEPFDRLCGGGDTLGDYGRTIFNTQDSTITLIVQQGPFYHNEKIYKMSSNCIWSLVSEVVTEHKITE